MDINIPRINDTDPANSYTFNKPIEAIESVLNSFNTSINAISSGSSLVVQSVPVSSDCFLGALVYFDTVNKEFSPAIAITDTTNVVNGVLVKSDASAVVGMVIALSGPRIADILVQGKYSSAACVNNCIGNGDPGMYYLSDTNAGKASKTYRIMPQPVFTYLGGPDFVLNITHQIPYQYAGSVLRGAISGSDLIRTTVDNYGILSIGINDWVESGRHKAPYAISDLNGPYYHRTPVVTAVHGIGEISVKTTDTGEVYIADSAYASGKIHASEYNLNGVKRTQDSLYTYFVYPSSRTSSMTISTKINVSNDASFNAGCWMDVVCNGTITASARVSMYMIKDINGETELPNSGDTILSSSIPISVSGSGKIKTQITSGQSKITGPCTLMAKIEIHNQSASDIPVLRAGFMLDPVSSNNSTLTPNAEDRIVASGVAGTFIPKDSVVTVLPSGRVVLASADIQERTAYGVSTRSCDAGDICEYTICGVHKTSESLSIGSLYFVGIDGAITTTAPDYPAYIQRVGRASGRNTLLVGIEEAVL